MLASKVLKLLEDGYVIGIDTINYYMDNNTIYKENGEASINTVNDFIRSAHVAAVEFDVSREDLIKKNDKGPCDNPLYNEDFYCVYCRYADTEHKLKKAK